MATWKEKGEVPDSDDDEELESLRSTSPENEHISTATISNERLDGTTRHTKDGDGLDWRVAGDLALEEYYIRTALPETRISNLEGESSTLCLNETTHPPASLESLDNLDFPPLWFENETENGNSPNHNTSDRQTHLNDHPNLSDEVSKSYVRITSGASSPLSSPPGSLPSLQPSGNQNTNSDTRKDSSEQGEIEIAMPVNPEDLLPVKRNFRQRKGIQIHPYRLEDERYHRILRERGIRPTKIADSQERQRASQSGDPDSQLVDFQTFGSDDGFIATEESQTMEHSMDIQSSPLRGSQMSIQSLTLQETLVHPEPMDSDEEFPDIDVLLRQPHKLPSTFPAKQRPKTYLRKEKRTPLTNTRVEQSSRPQSRRESSIFDIPASPPSTSSPFPVYGQRTISRPTSTASKKSTPYQRQDHPHRKPADIPTPATSAVKFPSVHINSGSDIDDAMPDDDEASESSASSLDESLLIRRVGKRIRGVLPASHLRLDLQKRTSVPRHQAHYSSRSVSPSGPIFRPGVALPTVRRNSRDSPAPSRNGLGFLEELSDDDEEESISMNQTQATGSGSLLAQSRVGYAEEENFVDAMLPSRKRPGKMLGGGPVKRTKSGISDQMHHGDNQRQPRITEHLEMHKAPRKASRKSEENGTLRKRKRAVSSRQVAQLPRPPALCILDVTDTTVDRNLPLFIRVAARTARMKKNLRRQSPTRKFIKLANREDTADAQSVLQEWKDSKIQPKDIRSRNDTSHHASLPSFQGSNNVQQTKLRSPVKKMRPQQSRPIKCPAIPRRLVITAKSQQSMNDFVSFQQSPTIQNYHVQKQNESGQPPKKLAKQSNVATSFRPAQLEANAKAISGLGSLQSFQSSKKLLDVLYRSSRKRAIPQLPLHRFLADDDEKPETLPCKPGLNCDLPIPTTEPTSRLVQHRKRRPHQIDVGAAEYRQPDNPLILDLLSPSVNQNAEGNGTKLLGLGGYGTIYPVNFDIFPLPPGVFFHESTFIGSRRLADALRNNGGNLNCPNPHRISISLLLGTKKFDWGLWNENVSSEVGICFDWIVDQYSAETPATSGPSTVSSIDVLEFVSRYIQDSLTINESRTLHDFLSRMTGVLDDFFDRLNKEAPPEDSQASYVRIMGRCALICLQVLHLSRSAPDSSPVTAFALEALLRKVVGGCIKVLITHGLEDIRRLYDNLQYLSFRNRGIRSEMFAIEAWVIVLKVLNKAQIPRESFLDVVNSVILRPEVKQTQDARVMEKAWYFMFSLLPLCDFDNFGVIIPGTRHEVAFDNWSLPQQMLRRVFDLYGSNERQSPSFNDYCRSIVSRCHYLMVEWGWWTCRGIIGTLFDFFASHNLAHLRNEEVYTSPHFLEELHLDPSLAVEPEDRCFHIFLKIVALGIRRLDEINNQKGIRNLVARLLPNHNRQYPKEEEIHQRDLASLRNHHDLLCTLFGAAPPPHRPSPTLLQKLVNPADAHSQASLINIRAWENLARFVLASSPSYQSYLPLFDWRHALLDALWQQYQTTEAEVRSQADILSTNSLAPISEAQIMATVIANQAEAINLINVAIQAINAAPNGKMTITVAMKHFDMEALGRILDYDPVIEQLSGSAIKYLQYYIWILRNPLDEAVGEDSQESELGRDILDRFEALTQLAQHILGPLQRHLQRIITKNPRQLVMSQLIDCWANLVSLLMEEKISELALPSFVSGGKYAVVNQDLLQTAAEKDFWGKFLLAILRRSFEFIYSVPGFDVGSEWLKILALPPTVDRRAFCAQLSAELYRHGYCLLSTQALPDLEALLATDVPAETVFLDLGPVETLKLALRAMKNTLKADLAPYSRPAQVAAIELFKGHLKSLMSSLEANLRNTVVDSYATDFRHDQYVEYVQEIVGYIHIYCSHIQQLPPFFRTASKYYWPSLSDPLMFIEHSKHLSLELIGENPDGAASTLFYYLVHSFDVAVARDEILMHTSNLWKVLGTREHLKFVLKELVAPMLDAAFQIEVGWVLCCSYFPTLAAILSKLFLDDEARDFAFRWATAVLDTVMFNLELYQDFFKDHITGLLKPKLHHILAIVFSFCNALRKGMLDHIPTVKSGLHLEATHRFFESMAINISIMLRGATPSSKVLFPAILTPSIGTYYEKFGPQMKTHVDQNWMIDASGKLLVLKKDNKKAQLIKTPELGKVLALFTEKSATTRFIGSTKRFFDKLL